MADGDKLLEKLRRTRFGWGWRDLDRIYLAFGFEKDEGAKHTLYIHPEFPELRAVVARQRSLAAGYATHAVQLIDRLKNLEADQERKDDQAAS